MCSKTVEKYPDKSQISGEAKVNYLNKKNCIYIEFLSNSNDISICSIEVICLSWTFPLEIEILQFLYTQNLIIVRSTRRKNNKN